MTTLITIEWKDGKKTAVHYEGTKEAARVLQIVKGDSRVKTATLTTFDYVQEAVSPVEAIELVTGLRL